MKRIDWLTDQIAQWTKAHRESEGAQKTVARARLLDLLAENAALTAGQGQEIVQV